MKTTIEINGKLYDAKTGKVIGNAVNNTAPTKAPAAKQSTGVSMDGVVKNQAKNHMTDLSNPKPRQYVVSAAHPNKQFAQDIKKPKKLNHTERNHQSANRSIQKSQTLKRQVVHKPQTAKTIAPSSKSSPVPASLNSRVERSATGRGMLIKKIPEHRLTRAMTAPKSGLVSKFGRSNSKKPQLSPDLKVQQAPQTTNQAKKSHNEAELKQPVHQLNQSSAPVKRSVFEDHLLKANSHNQKPVKKESRRKRTLRKLRISPKIASVSAAVFAIVILGGFFAYQNVPSVGMRIAANKAGFSGKLPGSVPAGYAFDGPIIAEPNNIVLTYKSNSDERQFVIQQKPTNWSSESLLTNYLLDSQFRYQVYRDKGLTIYIYNGSNATWVDKGVWYSVVSQDDSLSSEQLLELASSI